MSFLNSYYDIMAECDHHWTDDFCRGHLDCSGYVVDARGDVRDPDYFWVKVFVDKVVVARKDYPEQKIVRGQKYHYTKTKEIEDESGYSTWVVTRRPV